MRRRMTYLIGVSVLCTTIAFLTYINRLWIAAEIWHWGHGDNLPFLDYQVPVPSGWLVESQTPSELVLRATHGKGGALFAYIKILSLKSISAEGLAVWKSQLKTLLERQGAGKVTEHELRFGQNTVVCLIGDETGDQLRGSRSEILTFECNSDADLKFVFIGESSGWQNFDDIVSHIRKMD